MGVSWSRDAGLFPANQRQARTGGVYHTTGDTIKVIEPDTLERVVNTAVQVIRRLDS
jgi:hypothetical protein